MFGLDDLITSYSEGPAAWIVGTRSRTLNAERAVGNAAAAQARVRSDHPRFERVGL